MSRAPSRSSADDVADATFVAERDAAGDHRDLGGHELPEEALASAVRRHEQGSVDVAGGDELGGAALLVIRPGHQQHERQVALGERLRGSAHEGGEVRVLEQALVRLGEQERDGVRPGRRQVAGVRVGSEAGLLDRLLDGGCGIRTHPMATVEHARHRAAGDAGLARDILDRRALARGALCHGVSLGVGEHSRVRRPGLRWSSTLAT